MNKISTHVLDTARGCPAEGIHVMMEFRKGDDAWTLVGEGVTNSDGRIPTLLAEGQKLTEGDYRLSFDVAPYFEKLKVSSFYQTIPVEFFLENLQRHYHVPLLLSPFGYSTYRGS